MPNVIKSQQTKRMSMHDWIKQRRKELGYKPAKKKSTAELTTIHIETPKKELEKKKKAEDNAIRQRMMDLFQTYSERAQKMLSAMSYDEMVQWIVEMEDCIQKANSMVKKKTDEVFYDSHMDRVVPTDEFDIVPSQMAAYKEFLKKRKLKTAKDVFNARLDFQSYVEKKKKKYSKKGLNLYDPLFHGADADLQQMKKNLKRLNADNKKRIDAFLADLDKLTGKDTAGIPIVKAFREKTDRILKQTNKWLDSQGIGSSELIVEF